MLSHLPELLPGVTGEADLSSLLSKLQTLSSACAASREWRTWQHLRAFSAPQVQAIKQQSLTTTKSCDANSNKVWTMPKGIYLICELGFYTLLFQKGLEVILNVMWALIIVPNCDSIRVKIQVFH